jgi:hypothetical protein
MGPSANDNVLQYIASCIYLKNCCDYRNPNSFYFITRLPSIYLSNMMKSPGLITELLVSFVINSAVDDRGYVIYVLTIYCTL